MAQRLLFIVFLVPFLLALIKAVWQSLIVIRDGKVALFSISLVDWLINYEAGFVRRGLLGTGLLRLTEATGVTPALPVTIISTAAFAALIIIAFRAASGFPRWALLSTPLLAFRLNTDIYIGKDSFTILMFLVCLILIRHPARPTRGLAAWSLLSVLSTLSHEAFFLITVPLSWLLMWRQDRRVKEAQAQRRFFDGSLQHSLFLIAPLVAVIAIYLHRGNAAQALVIENSWRLATGLPVVDTLTRWTQIWWLSFDARQTFGLTLSALTRTEHGIPYWLYAVTMLLLAIAAINALWRGKDERTLFPWLCALQLIALAPVIAVALDTGRWVHLIVITAFLATCLYRQPAAALVPAQLAKALRGIRLPPLITPVILFLWGMPIGQSMNSYTFSSLGNLLARLNEAYILARLAGLPHPASWLH